MCFASYTGRTQYAPVEFPRVPAAAPSFYTFLEGSGDLCYTVSLERDARLSFATLAQRVHKVAHRDLFRNEG